MEFRTKIETRNFSHKIDLKSKILAIGSCFTTEIFNYLSKYKIDIISNPFGILFNPISIFQNLENSLKKSELNPSKIIQNGSVFYHYDFHSQNGSNTKKEIVDQVLESQNIALDHLKKADFLFLTLGTAWVYEIIDSKEIVANCHKQPSTLFSKRLLDIEEITQSFFQLKSKVEEINPNLKYVFTVSPVRHTKEGLVENNISKSTLLLAINKIRNKDANIIYFPSYEIVMDDLRDYRFFGSDLIHPNAQAVSYIFEYFQENFTEELLQKHFISWDKLYKMLHHRPFNEETEEHKVFLRKLLSKLQKYPYPVDLSQEILAVKEKLRIS